MIIARFLLLLIIIYSKRCKRKAQNSKHLGLNLDNLVIFVDNNNLQIDGSIEEVNSPHPIDKKFEAFGFETITINGNDFDEIEAALDKASAIDRPVAIIAKTVKGKGVSYMENAVNWHGAAPNDELFEQAMAELKSAYAKLN